MIFEGKTVLVTGASRGIGSEIAKTFVKLGAFVIGSATSEKSAKNITSKLKKYGKGIGIKMDLSAKTDIDTFFDFMRKGINLPDILVNNAGITRDNLTLRLSEKDWSEVIDINLSSIFKLSKWAIRHMIKKRWGRIINIGSIVASSGNPGQTNYCASKAGMIAFSKSLAQEVASRNITVNVISPGFIKTDMTDKLTCKQKQAILNKIPLKTVGIPKDIAEAVMFIASDHSGYITGHTLHINGGMYMV